ncbi:non-lysosomal glucosylceramidase [Aggregatilinea sp.]|uniref:non-lysosomal glucosylceramidase n=1 Tax=Aggregatilinea sp. TaxID=2806333 RepID=UPI0032C243F6
MSTSRSSRLPPRHRVRSFSRVDVRLSEAGLPVEDAAHTKVTGFPTIDDGPVQGAPLGGLGTGTFARTYAGNFARWHIRTGAHAYGTAPADMFSVYAQQGSRSIAQALWTGAPAETLAAWQWNYPVGAGTYYALYPRSWFVYDWDALPVDLSVEQFSPIIPGDYEASSYPVALFNWTASNPTDDPVTVGVMFTFASFLGTPEGRIQRAVSEDTPEGRLVGVEMGTLSANASNDSRGTIALAALETPGVSVSYRTRFQVTSSGADIWQDFSTDGALDNVDDQTISASGDAPASGVAITFTLAPGETIEAPFALAWDLPVMAFSGGDQWYKRYTAFFGRDGNHAWDIAAESIAQRDTWRSAIEAWQDPILADESRPEWYKTALFNELYYLADGGTAWEHGKVGEPEPPADYMGHFAYLECFDYPYYNTFDVDFYASFATLELWPDIELSIMRDFAASVFYEDTSMFRVGYYNGKPMQRKVLGAVPHDMGTPGESPWLRPNAFTWQDVNGWKDLNAKFVQRLYRDAVLLDQPELIKEMWPAAQAAMDYLGAMDHDGDGIPENEGIPDQTYDTWPATGVSAYSGGLWLGALAAMREMALIVGDEDAASEYGDRLAAAQEAYEAALWNGTYFDYDQTSDTIMADMLAGEWYATISGLSVLPPDHVDSALDAIYTHNVQGFNDGQMGAVNGMRPDGTVEDGEQASEVWAGTTWMLAAHMLFEGLDDDAWATAWGLYHHVYETGALWFRTPEAWDAAGDFRAAMYMRPLAVWAMETALERR